MTAQALPYVSLLGFLFGTSMVASRFGVGQFQPSIFLGLRLSLAGLCHVAVYGLVRDLRWPSSGHLWQHAAVLGVIGTAIPMTAFIIALKYLSTGVSSLLITAMPAVTVLLAHVFLPDEGLTRRKGLGVALALGGAVLLVLTGESGLSDVSKANPLGYGLMLLSTLAFSCSTIYARKFMRDLGSFDVASARMFIAALIVMPLSVLFGGLDLQAVDRQGYFSLVYAAVVGTFAGLILSFYNLKRFGVTAAAMSAYVTPVVATIGGILILGETFTTVMLIGMGLIIAGIVLINQRSVNPGT